MALPLVLASSSPYRRELLARLGVPFEWQSPDIDESRRPGEPPDALSRRLAETKARAIAGRYNRHLIIGSDQVAALGQDVLTKPGGLEQARTQLARASGQRLTFHTALALLDSETGHCRVEVDTTETCFRTLQADEIERYLAAEQPFDCAGSFKVEGLGITLFEEVATGDPTALVGLPLIRLAALLRDRGYQLP